MFGRVRPPCSVDSLERASSKIIKDDSLSIYEATLMKLKLGSQRDLSSHSEKAMNILPDCTDESVSESSQHTISSTQESMVIDADSPCASLSSNSSPCQSTGSSKQLVSRNVSVIHLFSKYENARHVPSSPCDEAMIIEDGCSASSSPESSICQSTGN